MESLTDLQLARFCSDISADLPCGEKLEYDPGFEELVRLSKGSPERHSGDSTIPAEPPDWKAVRDLAYELLTRSHDIQVSVYLTCALVHTDGIAGFSQGLALIHDLLQTYWDKVYPVPDPDDEYPVQRINILTQLNDYGSVVGTINRFPLADSKRLGQFSWRDLELARGNITASGEDTEIPEMDVIEAAFKDTDIATLQAHANAVDFALQQLHGILSVIIDQAGEVNAPDLSVLDTQIQHISRLLQEKIQQGSGSAETDTGNEPEGSAASANVRTNTGTVDFAQGIRDRNDVIRAIDAMCKYFERHEPSSPVPFLLHRAKKLLAMNFIEILQDLTPDSVSQAENICGIKERDDS